MEYPLGEVIRKFFQGLNIEKQSKNNSAIPDLDKRKKTCIHIKIYTWMPMATLFIIDKKQTQSKCLTAEE